MMLKRVLFVEDDPSLVTLYRRVFSRKGYEVLAATDSEQALEIFRQTLPDAVVVDVKLTGEKDGLDLLGKLLLIRRVPAVINTAYACFRESFLSWAADAYILKSSDLTELTETLRRLLSEGELPQGEQAAGPPLAAGSARG
jgi:two-component system response regulator (stage 0 sporulation protein F)